MRQQARSAQALRERACLLPPFITSRNGRIVRVHQQESGLEAGRMSWPGRALYAVAAVVVGGVFTSIPYFADSMDSWGREERRLYGFFVTFTLAAAGGFLMQIVFAALLRWLTRLLGLRGAWHWIVFGAVLGLAVPWSAAKLGYLLDRVYFTADLQQVKWLLLFPLQGSMMYVFQPLWVLLVVGAATGFVLRPIALRLSRMPAASRIRA